jgi:hypothetical protein
VTILAGLVSGAFWLGSLGSDVKHHAEMLTNLERKIDHSGPTVVRSNRFQVAVRHGVFKEIVKNISGGVKLSVELSGGERREFEVGPEVEILINGKEGKLEQLQPGTFITLYLNKETDSLISIEEQEPAKPPPLRSNC